jgi:hypothetical protein
MGTRFFFLVGARKKEDVPTRLIGDVHGKYARYKTILKNSPHKTIQVGDMGIGFRRWPHGERSANPPFDLMVKMDAQFIRGNHDNPEECRAHQRCIRDGAIESDVMFIGGALSIDRAYRYPDFSWWHDEELSEEELNDMTSVMIDAKPKMMITHECPDQIAAMIVRDTCDGTKLDPRFASRTRFAFDQMFAGHKPKLWVFGHWHVPFDRIVDGTRFICLPELATVDVDMEKAEVVGKLLTQRERW